MGFETLPDYLGHGLKILFVGTAQSSTFARRQLRPTGLTP
jgi:hypothetical protein